MHAAVSTSAWPPLRIVVDEGDRFLLMDPSDPHTLYSCLPSAENAQHMRFVNAKWDGLLNLLQRRTEWLQCHPARENVRVLR